jgi:hypothetical protein
MKKKKIRRIIQKWREKSERQREERERGKVSTGKYKRIGGGD